MSLFFMTPMLAVFLFPTKFWSAIECRISDIFNHGNFFFCVSEDKFEFENPRRNPEILAASHLPLTEHC